jgi:hypothetical protein
MTRWLEGASVVGKVEWEYEFLRGSRSNPALHAFDEWLYRNAAPADAAGDAPGDAPEPITYAFAARVDPNDPTSMTAGVVAPSRDRAGRRFASALVASLAPGEARSHPEILPVLLEGFWSRALEGLAQARSAPLLPGDPRMADLTAEPSESTESARALYLEWTRETTRTDACTQLGKPPGWLDAAVEAVAGAFRPGRLPTRDAGPRGVRVPLGEAAGASLCFWLDVVWRAAGRAGPCPSFFWSHDGRSGHALLLLPVALDSTLAMLWRGARDPRVTEVTELAVPAHGADRADASDPTLRSLLGDGDSPVSDLLDIVG